MTTVPLAVRVRNARYDGALTGYLHDAPTFQLGDTGGMLAATFSVDQRLGFRSDLIQPYSRIYIYNARSGETVFEGDISHPGRSITGDGPILEVNIEGGVERLGDWSGARIFIDRDMEAWKISNQATIGSTIEVGDDRGGSGDDALTLAFPNSFHVETNYRAEAIYNRIHEAGQELGRLNYSWDCGLIGWTIRAIVSSPSTVVRTQASSTAGSGGSGAVVGGGIPIGADVAFLQFIWVGGSSSTGTADTVWTSFLDPTVVARLHLKDGSFKTSGYVDWVLATDVWEDMLGDMLASSFDGPNAVLDAGTGFNIQQLAYPDGVTPKQVADALMTFETGCTYLVGPSKPGVDKYTLHWLQRSDVPRYEFNVAVDAYSSGAQAVDQYDKAVTRWKAPTGEVRTTVTTQSVPELTAAGRSRNFYQDLTDSVANVNNAVQANAAVLADHRFPQNGGQITVSRDVVDLWTGRRVTPAQIQPAYVARIVGVKPSRDALNNSPRNGSTLCRIVTNEYSGNDNAATLSLDAESWSMFRAIAKAKPMKTVPQRSIMA